MNTFIYSNGLSLIEKDGQRLEAFLKPEFSFKFDAIQFHESTKAYMLGDVETELSELEITELNGYIEAQVVNPQTQINFDSQMYLDETDKWVMRFLETGVAMPVGMADQRAKARLSISKDT